MENKKPSVFTCLILFGIIIYIMMFVVRESEFQCKNYVCTLHESSYWNKNLSTRQIDMSPIKYFEIDYKHAWWLTLNDDEYFIIARTKNDQTYKFFKNPLRSREEAAETVIKLHRILRKKPAMFT